ncbi:hypothetical protein CKM354_001238800 [Cercospora kikuchii]|uniref:Uncharacterized protein n=1 Tax=Cercospora kikuchii TaxID=84275 RepID=A0A9P3FLW7_9PEZI|nr:uncharacterized protein CKM354_001238800 [Cercospora kikuchii]GIZ49358.1 hypothetical protein CKM354_001238800 [Cercospora kikuchii]
MDLRILLWRWLAFLAVWQYVVQPGQADNLATITPCPHCSTSIAPKPVTITAQYHMVSTCEPSATTIFHYFAKRHKTGTTSTIKTVPSCSTYAWVSTTIPVYVNEMKTSAVITTTNQPVIFSELHYTEARTTTTTTLQRHLSRIGIGFNGTNLNSTYHNQLRPITSIKVTLSTINIKKFCGYDSIGPLAISGYGGSGLCMECGPDVNNALTQRLTVISCSNRHCTTFNETWISSPTTYTASGKTHTVTTTKAYCPSAIHETARPGNTHLLSAPSSTHSLTDIPTAEPSKFSQRTASHSNFSTTASTSFATSTRSLINSSPTRCITTTTSDDEPEPTEGYGGGEADPSADPSGDPSGNVESEHPAPTAYHHHRTHSYKIFERHGLEQPRGHVMKRGGLLFWGL